MRRGVGKADSTATELQPLVAIPDAVPLPVVEELRDLRVGEFRRRRRRLLRRALVAADVVGLAVAFLASELVFELNVGGPHSLRLPVEVIVFALTIPGWIVVAELYGLYGRDEQRTGYSTVDDFLAVFHLVTVGTLALFVIGALTGVVAPDVGKVGFFWATAIAAVTSGRAVARSLVRHRIGFVQNVVVVGDGDVSFAIARKFLRNAASGLNLVGFVAPHAPVLSGDLEHVAYLGDRAELPEVVGRFDVDRVVVAFGSHSDDELLDLIRTLKYLDVQIDIVPRLYEVVGSGIELHEVGGFPLIGLPRAHLSRTSKAVKRTLDLAIAVPLLLMLAPFFVVIAVLIKLESEGPVFFKQVRMGSGDNTFWLLKFRTMVVDAEQRKASLGDLNIHAGDTGPRMFKVEHDPRVTRVGRVLRRYFADELPQLINVVRGEMSLVGPRPLVLDEDQHVEAWARRRLDLKPGMTGLWQVRGRISIPFEEMVRLDYQYVTSWSIASDLRLLLRTIPLVLRGDATGS